MPQIGEIRKASEIGFTSGKWIWRACIDCGKERWVQLHKGKSRTLYCFICCRSGERNPSWKGGICYDGYGYRRVKLFPNAFFYPMVKQSGYVLEHRLVMARALGRCLHSWEIVHHKNGIKDDNRLENLQLVSDDRHKQITILENRIKTLEKRVTLLEAENVLLRTPEQAFFRPIK